MMRLVLALTVLAASLPGQAGADKISWVKTFDAAAAQAKAADKPILLAFNMDKERANDLVARDHYTDARLVKLSREFVCCIASKFRHRPDDDGPCPRFGTVTCGEHIAMDQACRERFFEKNVVNAPQHMFLKADATFFRTKVFYVTKAELAKLLDDVLKSLYPERYAPPATEGEDEAAKGKTPEAGPSAEAGAEKAAPKTVAELGEAILASKDAAEAKTLARQLVKSKDPAAAQLLADLLENDELGERRYGVILAHGFRGNKQSVPILLELLKHKDEQFRDRAAVALEDIADPSAVKTIAKRLKSEKSERVRKNLARALGACGATKKGAAATLIKLTRDRSQLVQRNAAIALGKFKGHKKAERTLIDMAFAGGRGFRRTRAHAAIYALSEMGSEKALAEAEKRAERNHDPRLEFLFELVIRSLSTEFDPLAPETVRSRRTAGGDRIARDEDPEGLGFGPMRPPGRGGPGGRGGRGDGGAGGDRP